MIVYRILLLLALPVLAIRMISAVFARKESVSDILERFGHGIYPAGGSKNLWLHGASLGELTAAKSLIQDILNSDPDLHLLVSANTVSGRNLVSGWNESRITVRLAPLDNPLIVGRFMNQLQPIALLSMENEIWPMRTILARKRGVPILQVSARMSKKSAAMWGRFPGFSSRVIGAINAVFPMDSTAGNRFLGLGLPERCLMDAANLKSAVQLPSPNKNDFDVFSNIYDKNHTILAGLTHNGEDQMLLDAFQSALPINPDLKLIIAPRHENRSSAVAAIIESSGLKFLTRSAGAVPGADTEVYLADSTGEMALWYSLAGTVLLGGSWVKKGGHSPFEAVQFGCLVVHGPDVSNHTEAYQTLHSANACHQIDSVAEIAEFLGQSTTDAEQTQQREMANRALEPLRRNSARTAPILSKISELTT